MALVQTSTNCGTCGAKLKRRKGWVHCPTYQCKVDTQFTESKELSPGSYKFKRLGDPYYD